MADTQHDETGVSVFLSGAEMHPTDVLAAFPGARFVARARVSAEATEIAAPFAGMLATGEATEVWGILIHVHDPSGLVDGTPREAVTDDGRSIQAVLPSGGLVGGAPPEALAAARYWELPPDYVARLRDAVAALGAATDDEE